MSKTSRMRFRPAWISKVAAMQAGYTVNRVTHVEYVDHWMRLYHQCDHVEPFEYPCREDYDTLAEYVKALTAWNDDTLPSIDECRRCELCRSAWLSERIRNSVKYAEYRRVSEW